MNNQTIARISRLNMRNKKDGLTHRIHAYKEDTVSGGSCVYYIYDTNNNSYLHHRTVDIGTIIYLLRYYRMLQLRNTT